jgi:hypothetical protein
VGIFDRAKSNGLSAARSAATCSATTLGSNHMGPNVK